MSTKGIKIDNELSNDEIITGLRGIIKEFPINRKIRDIIADRLERLEKENEELKKDNEELINEKNKDDNKIIDNIWYNSDETLKKINELTDDIKKLNFK